MAWYRLHVSVSTTARTRLSEEPRLIGMSLGWESATVDAVYVDGVLSRIDGDLSPEPRASPPWPVLFDVPSALLADGEIVVAVRTWMHPRFNGAPTSFSSRMGGEPWVLGPKIAVAAAIEHERHTKTGR